MQTGNRRNRRGPISQGPVPLKDSLGDVSRRLGLGRFDVVKTVFSHWEEIVGKAIAAHVQPHKIDGESLILRADHAAWATQVRRLSPQILARMGEVCGGGELPSRIDVRVRI